MYFSNLIHSKKGRKGGKGKAKENSARNNATRFGFLCMRMRWRFTVVFIVFASLTDIQAWSEWMQRLLQGSRVPKRRCCYPKMSHQLSGPTPLVSLLLQVKRKLSNSCFCCLCTGGLLSSPMGISFSNAENSQLSRHHLLTIHSRPTQQTKKLLKMLHCTARAVGACTFHDNKILLQRGA